MEAREMAEKALAAGLALERFRTLVVAQGGDAGCLDDPDKLPQARLVETIKSGREGFLKEIHAQKVGEVAVMLGAGREKKGDSIDHAVGLVIHHKVGEYVGLGEPLFTVHANHAELLETARLRLNEAHLWSDEAIDPLPLFYETVKYEDISIED